MPEERFDVDQVSRLMAADDNELYADLTQDNLSDELFSYEGRVQEGRAKFRSALIAYRPHICAFYAKHKDNLPQAAAVIAGLATALSTTAAAVTLPLTPFSILVVRYGFAKLCDREEGL